MKSPVSKVTLLLVAMDIRDQAAGKIIDRVSPDMKNQDAFNPLREYPALNEALITFLLYELQTLDGEVDKTRVSILRRRSDEKHREVKAKRDTAWEDYEMIRRMVAADERHLDVRRVVVTYL